MAMRRRLRRCELLGKAMRELLVLHTKIYEGKNGRGWKSILNPVINKSWMSRSFVQWV
jgi:hypothetical protein